MWSSITLLSINHGLQNGFPQAQSSLQMYSFGPFEVFQKYQLIPTFGNWEPVPKVPHVQLLEDLTSYLPPNALPLPVLHGSHSVATLYSTGSTYLALNHELAFLRSCSPGSLEDLQNNLAIFKFPQLEATFKRSLL